MLDVLRKEERIWQPILFFVKRGPIRRSEIESALPVARSHQSELRSPATGLLQELLTVIESPPFG
jgi:hypothetical protein